MRRYCEWVLLLACGVAIGISASSRGGGDGAAAGKIEVKGEDVSKSVFDDVNLSGTSFNNVNLSGSRFHNINFSDVTFTAAQIGGSTFRHIGPPPDDSGKQSRQRPVTFDEAMLTDSLFRRVDLSGAKFVECDLEGTTIDGVLVTDLLKAHKALPPARD